MSGDEGESTHQHCDVLVVGAGPAGSACARWLAQHGKRVLLADAQQFPRDKTCGDALIPDALSALARLDLLDAVMAKAQPVQWAHCVAPRAGTVDVPGEMAVLPRRELDALLVDAAVQAGAQLLTPWRLESFVQTPDRVNGAILSCAGRTLRVNAQWVVLATGAAAKPLLASGLCSQREPDYMALRGYVRMNDAPKGFDRLQFFWHPRLRGGYGWIFPVGPGLFNVGVGCETALLQRRKSDGGTDEPNLRELFDLFAEVSPQARLLQERGEWVGEIKGAPMRCNLAGAQWGRAGLLLAGEAAGSTFAFTGEGIGKALETGIACAQALLHSQSDAAILQAQRKAYQALLPRYSLYRKAQHFNRWPWMIDLAIWKARRSTRIVRALSDVLHERRMPGSLLSWRGLRALLFY